jgi:hypothetical protein
MFLIGLMSRALDDMLSASSGGALIGSVIFASLMNIESNFCQVWAGIPFLILAFYIFVRLLPQVRPEIEPARVSALA